MGLIARALALLGLPREKRAKAIEYMVGEAGPEEFAPIAGPDRCESRLRVGKRSWRCIRDAGHPPTSYDEGHAASDRSGRHW